MRVKAIAGFLALLTSAVAVSWFAPEAMAQNIFLQNFVNHEILNISAVIMTIAIGSISIIHIWFNELERKHGEVLFGKARKEINQSAYFLIALFVATLLMLIVRSLPLFVESNFALSIFNCLAIIMLLCSVITLVDIMGVIRALTPEDN